ncbi:MAG TPA: hypothetical protein VLF39_03280 [Candidatus Saccharimonadales bacterium]|nr:hypothetical protein [Candidatus Saccharimonadales bacterium]
MSERLTPYQRILLSEMEQVANDQELVFFRDKIIDELGELAIHFTTGVVITHEQPTSIADTSKRHKHTYTFEHDPTRSYYVASKSEWSLGDVEEANWVFNSRMKLPFREIISGHNHFSPMPNWYEVSQTLKEIDGLLEAQEYDSNVTIEELPSQ